MRQRFGTVGRHAVAIAEIAHDRADAQLEHQLLPREQPLTTGAPTRSGQLEPVVRAADTGHPQQREEPEIHPVHPDIREQEGRDEDRADDQDAAHRGHIGLARGVLTQQLRIGLARVADLHRDQEADHPLAEEHHDEVRQARGQQRPELHLIEHREHAEDLVLIEAVEQDVDEDVDHACV